MHPKTAACWAVGQQQHAYLECKCTPNLPVAVLCSICHGPQKFASECHEILAALLGAHHALLTQSCLDQSALCVLQVVFVDKQGRHHHSTTPQLQTKENARDPSSAPQHPPAETASSSKQEPQELDEAAKAPEAIQLHPQQWCCSIATFTPRQSGNLKSEAVVASIGSSSIVWELQNFPPGMLWGV